MPKGISIRAYARRVGVHHRAIRHAIAAGTIEPFTDGSINVAQADRWWRARHNAFLKPGPRSRAQRAAEAAALGGGDPDWEGAAGPGARRGLAHSGEGLKGG